MASGCCVEPHSHSESAPRVLAHGEEDAVLSEVREGHHVVTEANLELIYDELVTWRHLLILCPGHCALGSMPFPTASFGLARLSSSLGGCWGPLVGIAIHRLHDLAERTCGSQQC